QRGRGGSRTEPAGSGRGPAAARPDNIGTGQESGQGWPGAGSTPTFPIFRTRVIRSAKVVYVADQCRRRSPIAPEHPRTAVNETTAETEPARLQLRWGPTLAVGVADVFEGTCALTQRFSSLGAAGMTPSRAPVGQ
ncbi:MAG: hypothetical protein WKH64_17000, partial [Chloroflexia bacterium]